MCWEQQACTPAESSVLCHGVLCCAMLCYAFFCNAAPAIADLPCLMCISACLLTADVELAMNSMQGKEAFARAATDVFLFACQGVGQMQMLRISHNNAGAQPDWHLEKVQTQPSFQTHSSCQTRTCDSYRQHTSVQPHS